MHIGTHGAHQHKGVASARPTADTAGKPDDVRAVHSGEFRWQMSKKITVPAVSCADITLFFSSEDDNRCGAAE